MKWRFGKFLFTTILWIQSRTLPGFDLAHTFIRTRRPNVERTIILPYELSSSLSAKNLIVLLFEMYLMKHKDKVEG